MIRSLSLADIQPQSIFHELHADACKMIFLELDVRELGLMGRACRKFYEIQNIEDIWKIHAEKLCNINKKLFSYVGNFNSNLAFKEQVKNSPQTYNSLIWAKDRIPDLIFTFDILKDIKRNEPGSAPYHSMINLFEK